MVKDIFLEVFCKNTKKRKKHQETPICRKIFRVKTVWNHQLYATPAWEGDFFLLKNPNCEVVGAWEENGCHHCVQR